MESIRIEFDFEFDLIYLEIFLAVRLPLFVVSCKYLNAGTHAAAAGSLSLFLNGRHLFM